MRQRRPPPPPDVLLIIARSGVLSADGEVLLGRFRLQKNIADRELCVKCQTLNRAFPRRSVGGQVGNGFYFVSMYRGFSRDL